MGVDALTYMGNIIVECRKRDGKAHEGSQIHDLGFGVFWALGFIGFRGLGGLGG